MRTSALAVGLLAVALALVLAGGQATAQTSTKPQAPSAKRRADATGAGVWDIGAWHLKLACHLGFVIWGFASHEAARLRVLGPGFRGTRVEGASPTAGT